MAVYTVTNRYRLDGFAVLQLLTPTELELGAAVTVAGVEATFNGSHVVRALPEYVFLGVDDQGDLLFDYDVPIQHQVLYASAGDDVNRTASAGTLTYAPTCTWISGADVTAWLNIPAASANDTALITAAAAAANSFCWRRRQEAGYVDSLTVVPSADVRLATIMYGGAIYRARGSLGDQFATFDSMGTAPIVGMSAMVKQLLGVDRPAIA